MSEGEQQAADAARARLRDALQQTAAHDRRGFDLLYKLTSAKLFGICVRICGDRKAAEDVLQEVYLTIWSRAGHYDPDRGSVITWLAAIARNRAIDWCRVRRPANVSVEAIAALPDEAPDAEALLLLDDRERQLHLCLDQLDARQQEAIRTAFFGGMTYAELAVRKNVPLGTMKSWVRRGLLRLRECLGDDA